MNWGVLLFPGSNCAEDCFHAVDKILGKPVKYLWHKDTDLGDVDAIIIPGGFSYGDHLRPGAIAHLSPAMTAVKEFASNGGLVIGVCNGFQILTESRMLPGSLLQNRGLKFLCQDQSLKVDNSDTPFTSEYDSGDVVVFPIAHNEGNYYAAPDTIAEMEANGQILFRYCSPEGEVSEETNPNGSINSIAGIINRTGNVVGMMPHPERSADGVLGLSDGKGVFVSMLNHLEAQNDS
ncbi:MAG: phosphoribosylformylglycinamidine synthase subunit PurQ [Candidatus Marinimicrobia bacterium]|jgi:phosphoribosylformylglycinamidine synthase subunit PurQ / glutaminase|nr:phosphoribosylformylglycinamidine synthase subunit PurQ [Candidatus Neomarinimicrobiota bacterium]MBT4359631.1 phosphoribosylformylglycinamidine synthase subunit PurQ [Candidatus Neomarinimicrobiota bacterium]MBT4713610.1 phosphoribosylformylglycinamidine synthase subunit PurQ [Candidatus Neomarinimicrobiota bacterium]MBT4947097.1 phosphoribosylformylglycinamidine synthase subunit PurQ [Candidatus Neomarinimicrobiota bacterium]MBT6011754.1 phosphoribosylformylglycinamidine synthase subunit P